MSLQSRIESLRTRHVSLHMRIFEEDNRPAPNQGAVTRLKLEKLRVKDEMERLRRRI